MKSLHLLFLLAILLGSAFGEETRPKQMKDESRLVWLKERTLQQSRLHRYDDALESAREMVKLARTLYPRDSEKLADVLSDQAEMALHADETKEAITVLEKIAGIRRNQKPQWKSLHANERLRYTKRFAELTRPERDEFREAMQQFNQAYQLDKLDQFEESVSRGERGIELRTKALGYADSMVAEEMAAQGHRLIQLKRHKEGIARIAKAIEVQTRLTGEQHRHVATCLGFLSIQERKAGNLLRAEELLGKAATIYREVLGIDHETTQNTFANLVKLQRTIAEEARKAKDLKSAIAAHEREMQTAAKRWGDSSWQMRDARSMRDHLVFAMGATDEQIDGLNTALKQAREAIDLRRNGKPRAALSRNRTALESLEKILPTGHAASLECLAELIHCAFLISDQLAREKLREYQTLAEKSLGLDHPQVVRFFSELEAWANAEAEKASEAGDLEKLVNFLEIKRDILTARYTEKSWRLATTLRQIQHTKKLLGFSAEELKTMAQTEEQMQALEKLKETGRYQEGLLLIQKIVTTRQKLLGLDDDETANALHALAWFQEQTNDPATEATNLRVLQHWKKHLGAVHPRVAYSLQNLGAWYLRTGAIASAKEVTLERIAILRQTRGNDHPQTAEALMTMVNLTLDDDPGLAFEYRRQVEVILSHLPEPQPLIEAELCNIMAKHWSKGGYPDLALPLIDQAIRHWEKAGSLVQVAIAHDNRAGISFRAEKLDQAMKSSSRAVELFTRSLGENHPTTLHSKSNRIAFLVQSKLLPDAASLAAEVLTASRKNLQLLSAGATEQQNLEMYESHRHYLDLFLLTSAKANVEDETIWQEVLFWKGLPVREQFERRLILHEPKLRETTRALRQTTAELARIAFQVPPPESRRDWQERVAQLSERRETQERELLREAKKLGLGGGVSDVSTAEIQKLLPPEGVFLDFHVNRVYLPGIDAEQSHLYTFVVRRDKGVKRIDFGAYAPIHQAIQDWRTAVASGKAPEEKTLTLLRQKLADPMRQAIGEAKLVLFSPDAGLGQIPFAALPGKNPGEVLLDEFLFVTIPVAQMIPELLEAPLTTEKSLVLVGDIDFGADPGESQPQSGTDPARAPKSQRPFLSEQSGRFPELKGSAKEMEQIAGIYAERFGRPPEKGLKREQATEQNFRTAVVGKSFLHLATHGFFSDSRVRSALSGDVVDTSRPEGAVVRMVRGHPGLMSGIVFAGANLPTKPNRDDGILTAAEISEMDLRAVELAILSACETALGDTSGGEGVIGLQRSLHTAGVRTVVSSLWQVPDEATRALMVETYRNLWFRKMSACRALHEAQKTMRAGWDSEKKQLTLPENGKPVPIRAVPLSPFYWGGFVVSGSWK